jgi:hypothetical protein
VALVRFLLLSGIKLLSRVFFRIEARWVGAPPSRPFREARVGVLLNHTSLFEPILVAAFPFHWLWAISTRGVMPGADSTLDRPLAGKVFKLMTADTVSISRSRDATWRAFLDKITESHVVLIAPEGRMKRKTGLDKHGKPMTLRGGIVDILERKSTGTILLVYSEGLHHVQAPGEGLPRLFKRVRLRLEELPVEDYKKTLGFGSEGFRERVLADLQARRDRHCPWS